MDCFKSAVNILVVSDVIYIYIYSINLGGVMHLRKLAKLRVAGSDPALPGIASYTGVSPGGGDPN